MGESGAQHREVAARVQGSRLAEARRTRAELEALRKLAGARPETADPELGGALDAPGETDSRFRALAEMGPGLVAEVDAAGRLVYASSGCLDILGVAPETLVGSRPFDLLHPDDLEALAPRFGERLAASQGPRSGSIFRVRHRDGCWRWLRGSGVSFRAAGGETHILCRVTELADRLPVAPIEGATPGGGRAAGATRGTVLVADDDEDAREWLVEILHRSGFEVLQASGGREAVDTFRALADDVQLVILDRVMPAGSGEEALDGIRRIRPEVPVVLVSGYSDADNRRAFAGRRVDAFLRKPMLPETLLGKLDDLLDG